MAVDTMTTMGLLLAAAAKAPERFQIMDKAFRIRQALKETTYLLNKELEYPVDLQKADMIEFYRQHVATLTVRLKNI